MEIALTQGKIALIDDEDWPLVADRKWHAYRRRVGATWYAESQVRLPVHRTIRMHNLILPVPQGLQVDHVNGDGLDNRRSNLRCAANLENARNKGIRRDNRAGFKGVRLCGVRWRARIYVGGIEYHLGVFDSRTEAARAYDAAARELHGGFARLNFP